MMITAIPAGSKHPIRSSPYLKNILKIEGIIKTGLRAESESNITTANNAIGKKIAPQASNDHQIQSKRLVVK